MKYLIAIALLCLSSFSKAEVLIDLGQVYSGDAYNKASVGYRTGNHTMSIGALMGNSTETTFGETFSDRTVVDVMNGDINLYTFDYAYKFAELSGIDMHVQLSYGIGDSDVETYTRTTFNDGNVVKDNYRTTTGNSTYYGAYVKGEYSGEHFGVYAGVGFDSFDYEVYSKSGFSALAGIMFKF